MQSKTKQNKAKGESKWARRSLTAIEKRELPVVYLMLAPAIILLTIFVVIPLIIAVDRSFYDWTFYKESTFVGWDSYRIIVNNEFFKEALKNAFKFVIILVPSTLVITFLVANVLKGISEKSANFFKGVIYIPAILSGIMASVIAIFILDFRGGILNQIVMAFGGQRIAVLRSDIGATIAIAVITIWMGFGGNTILMYAALNNIDPSYYEAAAIDGASAFKKMIYITIPQMKNIFVLMTVSLTTGTLQMFDIPYMLTGGGPMNKTLTPMLYLYNNYRDASKGMGYTIAGALIMMVFISAINMIIFRVIRSEKLVDG